MRAEQGKYVDAATSCSEDNQYVEVLSSKASQVTTGYLIQETQHQTTILWLLVPHSQDLNINTEKWLTMNMMMMRMMLT